VGELFGDPHMVTIGKLRERAERHGFSFDRRLGTPLAFFARFESSPQGVPSGDGTAAAVTDG
jgi:hypothetical protein